jgi:hypothetical protein
MVMVYLDDSSYLYLKNDTSLNMEFKKLQPKLMGGLCNQMFQVLAMINLSKKNSIKYYISKETPTECWSIPSKTYWNTVFHKLTFTSPSEMSIPDTSDTYTVGDEDNPNLVIDLDIIKNLSQTNIFLRGYFQSSKYFDREDLDLLQLPEEYVKNVDYLEKKCRYAADGKLIFVHVRRGDYVNKPYHIMVDMEWYKKAFECYDKEDRFVFFSDDIRWCKENFNFVKNKIFMEDNEDFIDLYLMARMDGGIMSASSFSWFGAYLIKNPTAPIVCPIYWFKDDFDQRNMRVEPNWKTIPN